MAGWFISNQEPDMYYLNNSVEIILGTKSVNVTLHTKNGIKTVQDLMVLDEKELKRIVESTK